MADVSFSYEVGGRKFECSINPGRAEPFRYHIAKVRVPWNFVPIETSGERKSSESSAEFVRVFGPDDQMGRVVQISARGMWFILNVDGSYTRSGPEVTIERDRAEFRRWFEQ